METLAEDDSVGSNVDNVLLGEGHKCVSSKSWLDQVFNFDLEEVSATAARALRRLPRGRVRPIDGSLIRTWQCVTDLASVSLSGTGGMQNSLWNCCRFRKLLSSVMQYSFQPHSKTLFIC